LKIYIYSSSGGAQGKRKDRMKLSLPPKLIVFSFPHTPPLPLMMLKYLLAGFYPSQPTFLSTPFWIGGRKESSLASIEEFRWTWASSEAISKLIGTSFGLSLGSTNVDYFLLEKVQP